MKVTVTTLSDDIFTLVVSGEMELENFKAFCESESGIPAREIVVMHEGRPLLDDRKDLQSYGIKEGDILLIQQFVLQKDAVPGAVGIDFSSIQVPGSTSQPSAAGSSTGGRPEDNPEYIRRYLLSNPDQLAVLKHNNPRLADALLSGNQAKFVSVLQEQQLERAEKERQRIRIMNADILDLEAQKLIAEDIKQENIDSNMEAAMEYQPESFGQVVMLYINCKVNGHPVKAFIDSGAQTTIMSQACAERCNIMRLVDPRWAGIAKGVGTQKIIGRVHLVQIEIGKDFLTSSFSILEDQPMDMLLGLDMLKRHQCCIDLRRNILAIGSTNTETPFLNESELPECARLQFPQLASPSSHLQEQEDRQLAEALAKSSREVSSTAGDSFPEKDIESMTKLGFSREDALGALRIFSGDVNQAMASLLAKSLVLP